MTKRILVIDDNPSIHQDFRKIFKSRQMNPFSMAEMALFGDMEPPAPLPVFELDCAYQSEEGAGLVGEARTENRPYALVFVDIRMPPGWGGIETCLKIWEYDPAMPIVICTAYSDYSTHEMIGKLGHSDQLTVLKKPFGVDEILQLVNRAPVLGPPRSKS